MGKTSSCGQKPTMAEKPGQLSSLSKICVQAACLALLLAGGVSPLAVWAGMPRDERDNA